MAFNDFLMVVAKHNTQFAWTGAIYAQCYDYYREVQVHFLEEVSAFFASTLPLQINTFWKAERTNE